MLTKITRLFLMLVIVTAAACSSNNEQLKADESLSTQGGTAATESVDSAPVADASVPTTVAANTPDSSNLGSSSSGYGH